jgi:uncharacterized membrane protein
MKWIAIASFVIELLAVAIIVGSVFYSTTWFFYAQVAKKLSTADNDRNYKLGLRQSLLLGLEILVAADVIGPQPALVALGGGA